MKLKETTILFPQTEIWNDSCSIAELTYAIENGAVGATTNPVIVNQVLSHDLSEWEDTVLELVNTHPEKTEDAIAWEVIGKLGVKASDLLKPIFYESHGQKGRISFQVNAKFDRNTQLIVNHGLELASLAENSQIKAPASKEGIAAFEELTYQGISINATVCFTYAQAIAVAEAVERGLKRRRMEGKDCSFLNPVCTLMVGRLDDFLKKWIGSENLMINPEILEWAGVAVAKKTYHEYIKRGYTTRILIAAYRNHYHWSQFIGGNIVLTIPYKWQKSFNESDIQVERTIDKPIPEAMLHQLLGLEQFKAAYFEEKLSQDDFHRFGAYRATINQFLSGYDSLVSIIRKYKVNS